MKEILITSSVLIGVLMLLRLIFSQKVSRTLIYGAWILVALRLLIPVQIGQLDFSVLTAARPLTETVEEVSGLRVMGQNEREADIQVTKDYIEQDRTVFVPEVQDYIQSAIEKNETPEQIATAIIKTQGREEIYVEYVQAQVALQVQEQTDFVSLGQVAKMVWLCGVGVMTLWFAIVNLHHSRSLRKKRNKLEIDSAIPVYVSDAASSPCLVGLLRPVVYLTPASVADSQMLDHVVRHELTHYRHGDHIWSLVRCLCLCIYWFDPLVWAAAYLSRRDCELACDEGAMRGMDAAERVSYGKTLLEVVSHAAGPVKLLQTATSMNETGKQLKERVCFIVKKPKISITAAICMVLLCAIVAGCAAAGASTTQPPQNPTTTTPNVPGTSTAQKLPAAQIQLNQAMDIWFHGDVHLQCAYSASVEEGGTVAVTLKVTNAGAAFRYTGALEDQFGVALLRSETNPEYTIACEVRPNTDDATVNEFTHLAEASTVYQFKVPVNAPEDHYILETTIFGNHITFDLRATLRPRYIPCLADLPEEAQRIIVGDGYGSEGYEKMAKSVPIYYESGDVYVAYLHFYGGAMVTYETVNGLTFTYPSTSKIEVFTPTGRCSLKNAFETGLLNAEQIQQVYDTWLLIRTYYPSDPDSYYKPTIRLDTSIRLNHWGENRWGFSYVIDRERDNAENWVWIKLTVENNGPDIKHDNIKDLRNVDARLVCDKTGYTIKCVKRETPNFENNDNTLRTADYMTISFAFEIPEDFHEGKYTFVLTFADHEIRFDNKTDEEERKISILQKMDDHSYYLFSGKYPSEDPEFHLYAYLPMFFQDDGYWFEFYAFLFPNGTTDGQPTVETVNGLEFEIPDGYQFYVVSDECGKRTLTEAFESGVISEEELQQIYDDYIFLQNSSTTIKP